MFFVLFMWYFRENEFIFLSVITIFINYLYRYVHHIIYIEYIY